MALVESTIDGRGVLTITLNDPENRNSLSRALVAELVPAMERVDGDDSVRVALLTNVGPVFCAGADLSERSGSTSSDESDDVDPLALFRRIQESPKPWVGKIAGHAVAGGTGLAAALDISVAHADAKFGFTEVRLGLAPAIISVVCLPKMRRADAAEAFLRGRRFDGTEAARLGLINRAVEPNAIDDEVEAIVADLLLGGPMALATVKELLRTIPSADPEEALVWVAAKSAELFESDEAAAGMAAYLAKQPPPWAQEGS